ncbi:TPA: hypothetical protein HL518_10450 [Escherichia coli]|nr:hypothetical protein [Escherichia coli]
MSGIFSCAGHEMLFVLAGQGMKQQIKKAGNQPACIYCGISDHSGFAGSTRPERQLLINQANKHMNTKQ